MAAENFLLLIDTGQFASSWDEAAAFFKAREPKEEWVGRMHGLRTGLGRPKLRRISSAVYLTESAGAPPGQYYVIEYQTSFAEQEQALETITCMLDQDGKWRVCEYALQ